MPDSPRKISVPPSLLPGADTTWEPDPLIGTLVGERYRVTGIIGRGGMGVVYDAVHEQLGRPAAIKIVSKDYAHEETVIQRFLREARTVAQMGHPNIVDVYDLGSLDDHRPYLVMERLYGTNFHDLLTREGRMEPPRVVELLGGVAAALDLVHAKGVLHRDVKLENLLLARTDGGGQTVKILDFGIAAMVNPTPDQPRITAQNMITGTPLYISPEGAGGLKVDHRADIYALAVCAYILLTGVAPFDSDSSLLIMMRKMAEAAPKLADGAKDVKFSSSLEEVIARGLARHPDDRYSSASAFISDMRRVVDTTADLAPSPSSAPTLVDPEPVAPSPSTAATLVDPEPEGGSFGLEQVFERGEDGAAHDTPVAVPKFADIRAQLARPGEKAATTTEAQQEIARAIKRRDLWTGLLVVAAIVLVMALGIAAMRNMESKRPEEEAATVTPVEKGVPDPAAAAAAAARAEADARAAATKALAAKEAAAKEAAAKEAAAKEAAAKEAAAKAKRRPTRNVPVTAEKPVKTEKIEKPAEEKPPEVTLPNVDLQRAQAATKSGMRALVQGLIPQAIAAFREATLAAPHYAPAWRGLGLANEKLGRTKEAVEAYKRYLTNASHGEDALVVSEVEARVQALERP